MALVLHNLTSGVVVDIYNQEALIEGNLDFFFLFIFWPILLKYSHDFTYLVSGSEDKYVYIWSTYHDLSKFTSVRRDRNDFWEGIKGKQMQLTYICALL